MATESARGADGRFVASAVPEISRKTRTKITPRQRKEGGEKKVDKHWRTYFLQSLAETSNVTGSARSAGVAPSRAYKTRREDAAFAAQWRAALLEGYDHLEMEALGYLRAADPRRKFDIANAIRLLTMHRETVAAERARSAEASDGSVLDTIDTVIEQMRQRRAANAAPALESPGEGPGAGPTEIAHDAL